MGGHEEERQPLVDVVTGEGSGLLRGRVGAAVGEEVRLGAGGVLPTKGVHGASVGDGTHPAGRVGRDAIDRPRGGGLGEGVSESVLDEVRAPEAVDQLPEQPTPVLPPDLVEDSSRHGHIGSTTGLIWMS